MILPYLEQQALYNTSNVIGYPGLGRALLDARADTARTPNLYNMDWANSTLRSTRLNVFVCPTDANNQAGNFFFTGSDWPTTPQCAPMDQRTGHPADQLGPRQLRLDPGGDRPRPPRQRLRRARPHDPFPGHPRRG